LRFTSICGKPRVIISDNGSNFTFIRPTVGRQVEITDIRVREHFFTNRIDWFNIRAYSPWEGGAYERLIGIAKDSLKKALYPTAVAPVLVDYVQLNTAMKQVADIMNSRPLTYVPSDEQIEVITPNHFLRPPRKHPSDVVEVNLQAIPANQQHLVAGYRHIVGIVENFQQAFRSQYFTVLRDLQQLHHRHPRGSTPRRPKVGDVVLINEPNTPRTAWMVGTIDEVLERSAWVSTVLGKVHTCDPKSENSSEPPGTDRQQAI
jgi:hypothetical protein